MNICPIAEYCGGCQYQGIAYIQQLQKKQETVEKLLSGFGPVEKIIGMTDPDNYRNKMQLTFACDDDHKPLCGYYIPQSHFVIETPSCMLVDENINRVVISIRRILHKYKISVYDERSRKGCLRHLLLRCNKAGEIMVVFVTGSLKLFKQEELVRDIVRYNPEVKTIIHNINDRRSSTVLGKRSETIYGKGYLIDELCGVKFRISAASFYQVNSRQTGILYDTALELAQPDHDQLLLDAYCGIGTIGLCAASRVGRVLGVEINKQAITDAGNNMILNGISNCEFICEDAGRYLEQLSTSRTHVDTVIMDPPRGGSDKRFMSSLLKMKPDQIVYISCNPYTLKNDLRFLSAAYNIRKIQPVDMFPYTKHVETVVCLSR